MYLQGPRVVRDVALVPSDNVYTVYLLVDSSHQQAQSGPVSMLPDKKSNQNSLAAKQQFGDFIMSMKSFATDFRELQSTD